MGWDQKDAVGELLQNGDHVKVFRHSEKLEHSNIGDHIGEVVKIIAIEHESYGGSLQICLDFGREAGWAHQSSVMKV